ncbi:MAG: thioesterase [Bacteroidia bacterium]|nr:MAG: thioesterase [Bacteroidia bacterium]
MKKEEINIQDFSHTIPIQVRYIDIDMQGHVNNATFLSYIEQARVIFFNTFLPDNDFKKNGLIIARTEINYYEPILLNEEILCGTRIGQIGNKSFTFENIIYTPKNNSIKCFAKSVMVCYDYELNCTKEVPTEWKEKFNFLKKQLI